MNALKRLFGIGKLKCDVCNASTWREDGYALTTTQVTTNSRYWQQLLQGLPDLQRHLLLMTLPEKQAASPTPWLVCESCSNLFEFDRQVARDGAIRNVPPPGSGPANPEAAREAAVRSLFST